uniref:Uncharacterized protein n=1 Tax=viral metagenome TaxID=1070528 RepID=A0A6C0CGV1_9ZZZZ
MSKPDLDFLFFNDRSKILMRQELRRLIKPLDEIFDRKTQQQSRSFLDRDLI